MDTMVLRSMLKWPDVPSVYGWLRLDRRGNWLVKMPAHRDGTPRFERIGNAGVVEFIGRNYESDAAGRYFFQNGPQRVYVSLDYTPWIYRLDSSGPGLVVHTGVPAGTPREAYFDDLGGLVLVCDPGVGAVLDRDLGALAEHFVDDTGRSLDGENIFDAAAGGGRVTARIAGAELVVGSLRSAELAARYGFVPQPAPPEGQPDC